MLYLCSVSKKGKLWAVYEYYGFMFGGIICCCGGILLQVY